jgi:hypothetical protein
MSKLPFGFALNSLFFARVIKINYVLAKAFIGSKSVSQRNQLCFGARQGRLASGIDCSFTAALSRAEWRVKCCRHFDKSVAG